MQKDSVLIKLREKERKIRQEIILNSAKDLFKKKPFNEINMREIAKNIGISPASIYRFYSSRDALLCEILINELSELSNYIKKNFDERTVSIGEFAIFIVDYLLDNEAIFRMLCHFFMESNLDPISLEKFFDFTLSSETIFEKTIKELGVPGDPSVSTYSFFASLTGVVMCFYNYPDLTFEEKRSFMHQIALRNIENFVEV